MTYKGLKKVLAEMPSRFSDHRSCVMESHSSAAFGLWELECSLGPLFSLSWPDPRGGRRSRAGWES